MPTSTTSYSGNSRSTPLPCGKDSSPLLNFGQRKNHGDLFSLSSKSFHNLRKVVMPRIQQVMFEVLSKKHHEEWVAVLYHILQQQQQEYTGELSSHEVMVARKSLPIEDFSRLLIVKKAAELFLHAPTTFERDLLVHLFVGSMSFSQTNTLLARTAKVLENRESSSASSDSVSGVSESDSTNGDGQSVAERWRQEQIAGHIQEDILFKRKEYSISKSHWKRIKTTPYKMLLQPSPARSYSNPISGQHHQLRENESTSTTGTSLTTLPVTATATASGCCGLRSDSSITQVHTSSANAAGRLGLSAAVFARSAIVQQLIKAYHCVSPSEEEKRQKEYLLSLCVGSFTREQVNKFIVQPTDFDTDTDRRTHSNGKKRKRPFEQVSKVWWREIRQVAEKHQLQQQRIESQSRRKHVHADSTSTITSSPPLLFSSDGKWATSSHDSARDWFLLPAYSSNLRSVGSSHHCQGEVTEITCDGDEECDMQDEDALQNRGIDNILGSGELVDREYDDGDDDNDSDDGYDDSDDGYDDSIANDNEDGDLVGAFIQEDDAIFDIDE